jgi:class I lanthipeptide synthase
VEPANFFVLRTPLLPLETLTGLSDGLEAPGALDDPSCLRSAWSRDRARLRQRLQTPVRTPVIREAIFVASPDLDQAIDRWLTCPADPRSEATERAVVKYVTRMASRSTPFGLFAGSGVGTLGETTCLAVGVRAACRRHTRLDMDHLVALADALALDPACAPAVRYTTNSSLYLSGDRWRFVATTLQDENRSQHLVAVDDSAAVASTLERAREGATRAALAAALVDEEITADEADAFVGELIDSQILMPDIDCQITGCEPLAHLVHLLRRAPGGEPAAHELAQVAALLESLDRDGLGAEPARYRGIAHRLETFPVAVDLTRLFQVDLVRPAFRATLDRALVAEIIGGVDVLRRLTPGADHDPLGRFRAAFAERYEHREVPLVEALDEESGVGASLDEGGNREASPLLHGLDFPSPPVSTRPWGPRETLLLHRGNILLRPVLRSYEISYLGRSGAPVDQQIPITDFTLRLDGDRFVLRSRRLGRRIVPRLTSAHNFTWRTLNIYRFLCLLQSQGRLHGCTWDWVRSQRCRFCPASPMDGWSSPARPGASRATTSVP